MRLIYAEAFIENLERFLLGIHQTYLAAAVMRIVKEVINKQPTIEAKPVVHAHWKYYKSASIEFFQCSRCSEPVVSNEYNYCPHCGAQMDDEKNN